MDSKNLAICWWPTLLPYEFTDMVRFEMMRPHLEDTVQAMIDQFPFLFLGKDEIVMVWRWTRGHQIYFLVFFCLHLSHSRNSNSALLRLSFRFVVFVVLCSIIWIQISFYNPDSRERERERERANERQQDFSVLLRLIPRHFLCTLSRPGLFVIV